MEAKINDLDDYGLLQIVDKNDRYEGYFQRDSFVKKKCNRCKFNNIYYLPNRQFYCLDCIQLGRISTLNKLIYRPDPSFAITHQNFMTWKGQLTSQQNFVSIEIIQSLQKNKSHLLWAVTGAGKTETLFPLINYSLQKGYRLAIASPRLDVILELIPRIKLAFANTPIHSMFGGSLEEYKRTPITILTTHQLLKFQEAFDLIIIDEVDSFPYQNNPMLENAVLNALKINGKILYLSATPSKKIIKQNKQSLSFLSQRFHGRELPNFKVRYAYNWLKDLEKQKLPKILKEIIHQNLKQRFLLFVPEVKHLELIT
ncbi:MAG: DEAD/DEAH box helicase family protein, partial [Lactobacillaceae bacterium]|nr:DEAD/DEAH box helicase family protein [Lactobacillaceae bacterium]